MCFIFCLFYLQTNYDSDRTNSSLPLLCVSLSITGREYIMIILPFVLHNLLSFICKSLTLTALTLLFLCFVHTLVSILSITVGECIIFAIPHVSIPHWTFILLVLLCIQTNTTHHFICFLLLLSCICNRESYRLEASTPVMVLESFRSMHQAFKVMW